MIQGRRPLPTSCRTAKISRPIATSWNRAAHPLGLSGSRDPFQTEFRNRGSPIIAETAPKKNGPLSPARSPLKLSRGEGEDLSLARLIRRVNV